MSVEWTDGRIALLKRMWAAGDRAAQIAKAIGHGCTRNAVIGKAHRLGLQTHELASLPNDKVRRALILVACGHRPCDAARATGCAYGALTTAIYNRKNRKRQGRSA